MQFFLSNLCYFKKQNNKTLSKFEQNLIYFFKDVKQTIFIIKWIKNVFFS